MSNEIIHTGSVEIEGVSDAFRAEFAGILQNTTLPVVIRIGKRKCMVVLLPPDAQPERLSAELSENQPGRKRTILKSREREEIGEKIDFRFRSIHREQPKLPCFLIYDKISEESEKLLGHQLGPRQIDGRHHRYQKFLEKRHRKNARL